MLGQLLRHGMAGRRKEAVDPVTELREAKQELRRGASDTRLAARHRPEPCYAQRSARHRGQPTGSPDPSTGTAAQHALAIAACGALLGGAFQDPLHLR